MLKLLRRIQYLFRRSRMEAELAEEMKHHRDMLAGETPGDQIAVARTWGNTTLAREDARAVWLWPWLETYWQDLRYGIRGLRREPGFALVAFAALGVAMGLNCSLFAVFNAAALRPWPVRDAARVVSVMRLIHKGPEAGGNIGFSVADWRYLSAHSKAFTGLLVARNGENVDVNQEPLSLTWVTGNYFSVLGVEMARGRGFLAEEDRPLQPEAVAVLNYTTWQSRFGGDLTIVGKTVRLDDIPFTIVGVAPEQFFGTDPSRADFWAPLSARRILRPDDADVMPFLTDINHCCSSMAGRLAPGYTRPEAAAEVDLLMSQLHGKSERAEGRSVAIAGTALLESAGRNKQMIIPAVAAMFGGMTLVLLLACANVSNLLLARAAARRNEIAVRLSLGASRARLVRQLLIESLALAGAAAAAGLAIAWQLPSVILMRLAPENALTLTPDLRVCAYTAGLAILSCVVFGLAPALHGTRGQISGALKREPPLGTARLRLRSILLAGQVAISVVLLAGAGLMVRGLQRAQQQNPGFRVDGVAVAALDLPAAAYSGARSQTFTAQLTDALEHAPGLPATGMSSDAPMGSSRSFTYMRRTGEAADHDRLAQIHMVTAGYFEVLRIPLVAGRNFTHGDAGRPVLLLNETAAHRLWGNENPVGKSVFSNDQTWEVAGVVKDAYTTDLSTIEPTMYWPLTGSFGAPHVIVSDSAATRQRIAAIVKRLEPRGRVTFVPLAENLRSRLSPAKYAATLAAALGLLALALAGIGMCGVFGYTVRQRTREIGVRMALGAHPGQVVRLVLASNLRALAGGLVTGIGLAFFAMRLLKSMTNGVSPLDLPTYAGVFALLVVAGAAASALPARRAAKIDPVTALRWE